ncbi:hypothetical protein LQ327_00150 [Actinomycetospora endophytica]|uniref:Sigma-70-like protein n=1 Tax=Actinomycetospora endophytica TaxID=2291215 RepID=A0ABS8P0M1_9PSEU|nr:hypothetical protein [Actinomycetospora endophytica]MCD2191802.1 hypothetical protein [Actinomycetospora endophytica]
MAGRLRARRAGSSWDHVATALGITAEQARSDYLAAVEQLERHGLADVTAHRPVD